MWDEDDDGDGEDEVEAKISENKKKFKWKMLVKFKVRDHFVYAFWIFFPQKLMCCSTFYLVDVISSNF